MTAASHILRTATGEPPLGRDAAFFLDHQGEIFEHDNPRYRSPNTRIGVLALDGGAWLASPPSFHVNRPQYPDREAALRAGIASMVRRARRYSRAKEGVQWDPGMASRIIEWALGLKPAATRSVVGIATGATSSSSPARVEAEAVVSHPDAWLHAGDDAEQLTRDPVVRHLAEAHAKRRQFPARHTFSMTTAVDDGRIVSVATCECGHIIKFGSNDVVRMNAAVEAHWRRHGDGPMVDGRGEPIKPGDGSRIPQAPKTRKKKAAKTDAPPDLLAAKGSDGGGEAAATAERPAGTGDHLAAPLGAVTPAEDQPSHQPGRAADDRVRKEAGLATGPSEAIEPAPTCPAKPAPIGAGKDRIGAGDEYLAGTAAGDEKVGGVASACSALVMRRELDVGPSRESGHGTSQAPGVTGGESAATQFEADVSGEAILVETDDIVVDWPSYDQFLEDKVVVAPLRGIEVPREAMHSYLKPHCKDLTVWSLRLGCAAIFASFGLHKTAMQLEWCRQLARESGQPTLNVVPLGVRHGFIKEALNLGMDVRFVRTSAEVAALRAEGVRHFLTNYESIREGKLDPNLFVAVSLDEASVLRSYGSKTFQEFLPLFAKVPFKLVATATPSPNRYKELIHYAGFLGVMDTGLALTRFFQRNSEKAGDLTLYPHKEDKFWMWVHSWAAFLQKPSELGHSDDGYELPPLKLRWHEVPVDHASAKPERDGQGVMFREDAKSLPEAAKARRDSLAARVARMSEIIAADPADHFLIWHDLEAERGAIEDLLPSVKYRHWGEYRDGNPAARALYDRHYSARPDRDSDLILGPGEKLLLMTADHKAVWGWRKFKDDSGQRGVCCAVFRNEGEIVSSDLIMEAMAIAWRRWPGERLYTFVDAAAVQSPNPGFCFKEAGWQPCGETKGGLKVLEVLPADVSPMTLNPRIGLSTITGSGMDIEEREARLADFEEGRTQYFATKPVLSGSGSNFQYHCHRAIYVALPGYGYKFNDFIQSLYRLQRFGQVHEVEVDIIYAEDERTGRAALEDKWALDTEMRRRMSEIIRRHGLNTLPLRDALLRAIGVQRVEIKGKNFVAINNDAVAEARAWPDNSVDLIVTSIPFSNHYEYTPSYRDFGHTDDNGHFWSQMDFLSCELLRMLKPGRLACIHVKDRVLFGAVTGEGVPTISPFHAEAIMHYRAHGFQYLGMITVVTDVVRENNQTYRLGWSENAKDSTKMGVGSPEYILLLRKRQSDRSKSYADVPVTKVKPDLFGGETGGYSRAGWQVDAHAFWRSSGNRLLSTEEFARLDSADHAKLFAGISAKRVYDHAAHVRIGENLERQGILPATFMAIAPGSHCDEVWHDINRMRTLNMLQQRKGAEMHLCPLQFDIVDRLIDRYSNEGELVFDPFGGLMTVPYRALLKKRRGAATELSASYFMDGVHYLRLAEEQTATPDLFDLMAFDEANAPAGDDLVEAGAHD